MSIRMLDYYQKGLPAEVRQLRLPAALKKIGDLSAKYMSQAPQGYPSFKTMGMNEQQIKKYLERETENFKAVNQIMIQNGRPPLFPNPCNTYESSLRYFELIRRYHKANENKISKFLNHGKESESEEKLIKIMGCTWEEYIPEKYVPEDKTTAE